MPGSVAMVLLNTADNRITYIERVSTIGGTVLLHDIDCSIAISVNTDTCHNSGMTRTGGSETQNIASNGHLVCCPIIRVTLKQVIVRRVTVGRNHIISPC